MRFLARVLALLSLVTVSLIFYPIKELRSAVLWMPRLLAAALAPILAAVGAASAQAGWRRGDRVTVVLGGLAALLGAYHTSRVSAPHRAFDDGFGDAWRARITPAQRKTLLQRRWSWRMDPGKPPRCQPNIVYASVEGRDLLCDVWQPPWDVVPSGLAVVYCHGGGWHYGDKDMNTRPMFRRLAAQGHVVMDVSYRMRPETDYRGMLADVKRAVAWMKANAERYRIDPERVVLAGGSAGAHLAVLAAYTPNHAEFDPADINDADTSVRGVIGIYTPADLNAMQQRVDESFKDPAQAALFTRMYRFMGFESEQPGATPLNEVIASFLGGLPDALPEVYSAMSPLTHVGPHCPPTLLIHGSYDWMVPVENGRRLHEALKAAGVTVAYVELPHIDHAFDLVLPQVSPSAQAALYDMEHFLALLV